MLRQNKFISHKRGGFLQMKFSIKNQITKNIFIWLLRGIIFLFLLGFVCYVFLTTNSGEKIIKDILQNELKKAFNSDVTIQKLETNLFSCIRLHQVSISQKHQHNLLPLLKLKTTQINYNILHCSIINLY